MTPLRIALTFDAEHPDRPTRPGVAEELLDLLGARRLSSTVFVQGRWAEAYPATAARIASEGHLAGNHSHYHARMPLFTRGGLRADVRAAEGHIREILGVDPRPWFRCPFGVGSRHGLVLRRLDELGYRDVGWDVDSRDWNGGPVARFVSRVVRLALARGDGAVILFHTWPAVTPAGLPEILGRLEDAGARFVRLDELEALPLRPGPDPGGAPGA